MPAETWRDAPCDPFDLTVLGWSCPQPTETITVIARRCLESLILDGHVELTDAQIEDALRDAFDCLRHEAYSEAGRWQLALHPMTITYEDSEATDGH